MQGHRYRVTIEHLSTLHFDEPLDPPLVFETTSQDALMLLFIVNRLRAGIGSDQHSEVLEAAPRRYSTRPL